MKNSSDIENFIMDFIKKSTGDHEVVSSISLMDYGLDSMTLAALAGEITDKFGLIVDPVLLYESPSIKSVCERLCRESEV